MKTRIFQDGDEEMIVVPLLMQKRNFDALTSAEENNTAIPVAGIGITFDATASNPVARLRVNTGDGLRETQEQMGFYGVPVKR